MPGLTIPTRRRRAEEEEEDPTDSDESQPPSSQYSNGSKRPRVEDPALAKHRNGVLPSRWRSEPHERNGDDEIDDDEDDGGSAAAEIHKPGSIVRVKLTNFVTYTAAEFHLGPSLNMIIGPNGTGKSTLVCAICLGLGWGPQHLGRAKDLGEFVKHGCREADIEIELAAGERQRGRNPVIRRNIKRDGNRSQFFINGRPVAMKDVLTLAREFSIQIDNLCQFLPQDRVVEFAALSPTALLEQTQRAAAPAEMIEWHNKLKEMHGIVKKEQASQAHDKEALANLQSRQNATRTDVQRLEERQALENRIKVLEESRPLIQYNTARATANAAKERKKELQAELRELEETAAPLLESVRSKEIYLNEIKEFTRHQRATVTQNDDRAKRLYDKQDQYKDTVDDLDRQKKAERDGDRSRKANVAKLEDKIQSLKRQMREAPPEFDAAEYNERLREITRRIREKETELAETNQKFNDLRDQKNERKSQIEGAESEMEALNSQAGQQLGKLKLQSADTVTAWEWIQKNRNLFKGEIYGPPILECSVRDPRYVKAVEAAVRKSDLCAITCTDRQDFKDLQGHLLGRQEGSLRLSDINLRSVNRKLADWRRPMDSETLAGFGLDGWLVDQLEGPEPVLSMLCDNANLHKTGVTLGKIALEQYRRLEQSPLQDWVDAENKYRVNRRREYNASSTMVTSLGPPRIWNNQGVDVGMVERIKNKIAELRDEIQSIDQEILTVQSEARGLLSAKKQLVNEKEQLQEEKDAKQRAAAEFMALPQKLNTYEIKLRSLQEQGAALKEKMMELIEQQEDATLKRAETALQYAQSVEALRKSHADLYEAEIIMIEATSEWEILQEENKRTIALLAQRKQDVETADREYQHARAEAKRLQAQCARIASAERNDQEEEVYQAAQHMTLEELEADIEGSTARLGLLHEGNPNAIRDFNKRQQQIDNLTAKLAELDSRLQTTREQIKEVQDQWEPRLDALVQEISDAFSHNFEQIGCAGQVGVHKDEDFNEWSIQIQVKFREHEQLSVLDSHRQSGGERAVSTIFYLMALQSLARSPFRVVDEINQGMDPRNERMVHERMVDIACREHTSQYFLITPKLLSGLKYHKRMKVHVIASGEYMPKDSSNMNFQKLAQVALRVRGKA